MLDIILNYFSSIMFFYFIKISIALFEKYVKIINSSANNNIIIATINKIFNINLIIGYHLLYGVLDSTWIWGTI